MAEGDRQEDSSNIIPTDKEDAPQKKPKPSAGRLSISASQEVSYHSPIPPPQILAGYNTIVAPDAGDRILRLVETELAVLGGVFVYNTKRRESERKDRLATLAKNRQPQSKDEEP